MWATTKSSRVIAAVGAAGLLVALTGCSGGGDDPGGSGETFLIGATAALTGGVSAWGESQRHGAELALEMVNESGELDRRLEVLFEDDGCDPAGAQVAYRKLIDRENVDLLFGSSCSASALALADLAEEDGVVYYSPTATSKDMVEPAREYVFSTQVTSAREASVLVRMALNTYDPERVGFMFTSNEYGLDAVAGAKAALEEQAPDTPIVAEAGFPQGTTEFESGLIKLRDAEPDVVFVVGVGSDLGPMIRAARQIGVDAELVGFSSLFTTETVRTLGDQLDNMTGFFYSPDRVATDSENEAVAEFVTRYKEKYGEFPDNFALDGYSGILVISAALKNLGDEEPTPEALIEAFEGIQDFPLGVRKPVTFGPGIREGVTEGVLMKFLPGREEVTSLWGNFEIIDN